jgi:multiple sugar transport system permease protein
MVLALLGPGLILVGVFVAAPVVYAVYLSLTNKTLIGFGARTTRFVGLDNYRHLLSSSDFVQSLSRTGEFIFFSAIVGQFLLGLLAALLLTRTTVKLKGAFGGAILLPMVVPEVVASLAWASMLAPGRLGTLNRAGAAIGLSPVGWLQQHPMASIIVVNTWRGIAFAMIMFQAAIEGISEDLVEAAHVDGAGSWQVVRHITVPLIRGPVFLFLLLTTITTGSVFGLIYFLTQGGPGQQSEVTSIYIYAHSFRFFQIGLGSAASVILLVITLVLGVTYVRLSKVEV